MNCREKVLADFKDKTKLHLTIHADMEGSGLDVYCPSPGSDPKDLAICLAHLLTGTSEIFNRIMDQMESNGMDKDEFGAMVMKHLKRLEADKKLN